jgi:preprotein translocase subunit SecF
VTHLVLLGLGALIVVLTVVSCFGWLPSLRIVPDVTHFDFTRFRRISFPISAALSIVAITLFFTHGLNFGIDFKGGTLLEVRAKSGTADLAAMRSTLGGLGLGDIQLQQFGGPEEVLIRVAEQPGGDAAQQEAVQKVRGALGDAVDYRRVEVVGPRVSGELLAYGMLGLMLAIFAILIYLWFRFEWQFALGAMIANVHDIVLTIGFMSISQVDFDLTSIAALLTILGYSLNDTVVIYDRIREMLRRYKKMPMPELLNESINSTLSRSIITHVTVTLALLALLLFGGNAIHSFTAVMMFGVVLVGTYTSIFIAAPILIYLGVGDHRAEAQDEPGKKKCCRIVRTPRISRDRRRSRPTARADLPSTTCRIAARCCACRMRCGPGRLPGRNRSTAILSSACSRPPTASIP